MVPKFHAKGTSFKGIAQYVLHDKEADTSERVAWTETVNLATRNPDMAWRVQAATSMDADRLKKEAGIRSSGRKSKEHVQHVTLSWHGDEAKELNRDEQMRAVKWFLREIKADDRQVLVVSHNDQPNSPHVHLVINRVSPRDGRLLSSSFEKEKASRWAERYEKERGKIYCDNRVINNAARRRREDLKKSGVKDIPMIRAEKDMPRHVYEAQAKVANNNSQKDALLAEHRRKAFAIAEEDRETKARHKKEWIALQDQRKKEVNDRKEAMKTNSQRAAQKVRDSYRPKWGELHHSLQAEEAAFAKNETTLRGRMQNALRLVEWRQFLGKKPEEKTTLSDAFKVFSNEGSRRQALEKQFKARERALQNEQETKAKAAAAAARNKERTKLETSRQKFQTARLDLILKHKLERSKTKAEWSQHDREQRQAWSALARVSPAQDGTTIKPGGQVKASDILPKKGASNVAKSLNAYEQSVLDKARKSAANQNDRDRGDTDRGR